MSVSNDSNLTQNFQKLAEVFNKSVDKKISFKPSRVLMQDLTGLPVLVDLAYLKDTVKLLGGDHFKISPRLQLDLIIDNPNKIIDPNNSDTLREDSIQGFEENHERYEFLRWAQNAFSNLHIIPHNKGICNQINLDYLSQVVITNKNQDDPSDIVIYPDSLIGTDNHTSMSNAMGILAWQVGTIEAESVILGENITLDLPEVIGIELKGDLLPGITSMDLALNLQSILKNVKLEGKIVEFYGTGLKNLRITDRANLADMIPKYGALAAFFPVDINTLEYLKLTGKPRYIVDLITDYSKMQQLWYESDMPKPNYYQDISIDLTNICRTISGPKTNQEFVTDHQSLLKDFSKHYLLPYESLIYQKNTTAEQYSLQHGDIMVAGINSCTSTSNPRNMIIAGLLAKKASELGAKVDSKIKCYLAPSSRIESAYLAAQNLEQYLDNLGFNFVGYGYKTSIEDNLKIDSKLESQIIANKTNTIAVFSGNLDAQFKLPTIIKGNYICSPGLVIAYAIAGSILIDLDVDPLFISKYGTKIYLKDILPSQDEIEDYINTNISSNLYKEQYSDVSVGSVYWEKIKAIKNDTYPWKRSTYVVKPTYLGESLKNRLNDGQNQRQIRNEVIANLKNSQLQDIIGAEVLASFGDDINTENIAPSGLINENSATGKYLLESKVALENINTYQARRGNHKVMMLGAFTNPELINELIPDNQSGCTKYWPNGKIMDIYTAVKKYQQNKIPLVIFAGKEYGNGSASDWAAKATGLLGVKAIIAESFNKIHRANLIYMGILPLIFKSLRINRKDLHLQHGFHIDIVGLSMRLKPQQQLMCCLYDESSFVQKIELILDVNTPQEIELIQNGGILCNTLRSFSR